jgi:hypothetical protein
VATLQVAHKLLGMMIEADEPRFIDLLERSGLSPERYKLALRYLESVGKVRIVVLPSGRWEVSLVEDRQESRV